MSQNFSNLNQDYLNQDYKESLSDRLLTASASATSALLTIASFDDAVNNALKIIGEALETDRVTVIENFKQPKQSILHWRLLYEWDSPNTMSQITHPEVSQGTIAGIESWIEKLSQGESLSYPLDEIPEPFRSLQERLGVKVLHIVPIFVEGKHWGEFGFDDCREARERGQVELATLQIVANSIGGAIQRERTQQAILQFEQDHITELTKANNELIQRDRLLETTTIVANTLLTITPFETAIKTALKIIGEALDADRVNIIENFNHPLDSSSLYWRTLEYEWCSPNTASQFLDPDNTQGSYADIPSFLEVFLPGKSISYVIEDMPEPFRSKQIAIGVKSTHIVPIIIEGKWWGVLGLDDCREVKQRSPVELSLLNIAANCIGSAIAKDRTQKALLCSEQERAAELESANSALRNAIAGMARLNNLDHFLAEMLKASLEISGAHSGAVALIEGDFLRHAVLFDQNGLIDPQVQMSRGLTISPLTPELQDLAEQLINSKFEWSIAPDDPRIMPEYRKFHQETNNKAIRLVPMQISDRLIGWLGLGFAEEDPPIGKSFGLLKVLAEQMTMAVEMLRLSNEAQQTAIAREREQSLLINEKQRTAELEKANAALSRSLSWLAREGNLNKFLEQILLEISATVQADIAHLFILHQPERMLEIAARVVDGQLIQSPEPSEPAIFSAPFPADITPIFALMEAQDLLLTLDMLNIRPDLQEIAWPDNMEWHINAGRKALAALVLKAGDRSVGFLGLGFRENQELVEEKRQLVIALANQAALAILLMQLAEQSKQAAIARERELAAENRFTELNQANQAIQRVLALTAKNTSLDLFLGNVLQAIAEQFDTPLVEWWEILDERTVAKRLSYLNGRMFSGEEIKGHHGVPSFTIVPDTQHMEFMVNRQKYILVEDVEQLPYDPQEIAKIKDWYVKNGVQKFLNFPVITDERAIGGLIIFFPAHRYFSESQIEFGFAMARLVGLAIVVSGQAEVEKQTAIAHEQEQAAAARVVQLVKANAVLKQTLDVLATEPEIESSLGHVLKVSSEQLDSPSSALWLYNSSTDKFYPHLVYMDNQIIPVIEQNIDLLAGKWIRGKKLASDLFLKKHIRERTPTIYQVDDASVVPPPLRRSLENMGVKTLLGIPLLLGSEIIGSFTLRFTEKRQFQAEELELTQALANQATLAIQLLRMAEEAKQSAIYEERNRLAGEIHDTLAQAFTGISLQLGVVKWLMQEGSLAIEPILDRINDIAQTGLAEARRSVWEIYPTAQEYSNLAEKLSQAVEKLTRDCPIQVDLQILGSEYQVSAMIGYNLLRLAQEAITNALKHAKATKLSIILTYKDALVSLSITDNGCGFQPNLDNGGFGLLSISERSDRIGGQLLINSILGKGTKILVEIPLEEQKS